MSVRNKALVAAVTLALVLGGGLTLLSRGDVPIWISVPAVTVGMFLNGWLAQLEDDLPGGFDNPDGRATPAYVFRLRRRLRIAIAVVGLGLLGWLSWLIWKGPGPS